MTKVIISYDGTLTDEDALAFGRVLSGVGAELVLAYVRHTTEDEPQREILEDHEAYTLLERGTRWLDDVNAERRVVVSGSTAEGLARLALEEDADLIVFGSDYRTSAGHVAPQKSTQTLLEGGRTAVAIAPASYREIYHEEFTRVGLLAPAGDDAALDTARDLAESLGAQVSRDEPLVDLLVVGSRPEAPAGQVLLSAQAQRQLESATSPVIVVPRAVSLRIPIALALA